FVAKALSPARVREVFVDDDTKEATVIVPDDQLALAIGKEGLNARLAARLSGWKVDIVSDTEFAQQEAEAAYGGGDEEEFTGRCGAVLSNGKRCPNAALPGSRYCGVPAHQALEGQEPPHVEAEEVAETASPDEAEELQPTAVVDDAPAEEAPVAPQAEGSAEEAVSLPLRSGRARAAAGKRRRRSSSASWPRAS